MDESFLIVGAGVFGASTALHLCRSKPRAKVTLLDRTPFPNPSAASHDLNKIVRADYDDIMYMELALEAVELWRNDPIFKDYYHQTGMAFAENIGMGRQAIKNYKTLGADVPAEIISLEDARGRFGGIFKDANWETATECFWNPKSGWGEGEGALRSIIQAAIDAGAIYHEATVSTLSIDSNRTCTGAQTTDGKYLTADHVILSTGALTAKLLADTAPNDKNLQVAGRMVAAGACSAIATFAPELMDDFKKAPVFFNGLNHTHGESVPTTADGRLKFNCEVSFENKIFHEASKQTISVPPVPVSQSTWSQNVPQGLKEELQNVLWNVYGKNFKGLKIDSYRMCWDAVTPNQDFIISSHPNCKNLYIATGGSFHGWKFMPTIGKYVVQMLDGTLDKEKTRRWAWDRGNEGAACVMYIPTRDLKDIKGYSEMSCS
ncbi:sarcosine oxidase [Stipitochalara longipes BDJ]|nr:sarcosine oxidase [Stipitochalara longipes BDJ]